MTNTGRFEGWLAKQEVAEDGTGCVAKLTEAARELDGAIAHLAADDMWCATERWEAFNQLCVKFIGYSCPEI